MLENAARTPLLYRHISSVKLFSLNNLNIFNRYVCVYLCACMHVCAYACTGKQFSLHIFAEGPLTGTEDMRVTWKQTIVGIDGYNAFYFYDFFFFFI